MDDPGTRQNPDPRARDRADQNGFDAAVQPATRRTPDRVAPGRLATLRRIVERSRRERSRAVVPASGGRAAHASARLDQGGVRTADLAVGGIVVLAAVGLVLAVWVVGADDAASGGVAADGIGTLALRTALSATIVAYAGGVLLRVLQNARPRGTCISCGHRFLPRHRMSTVCPECGRLPRQRKPLFPFLG